MTKDGGQRIATADGAALADAAGLAFEADSALESLFEPAYWAKRNELLEAAGGRGSAWFVAHAGRWVLRHYRRGGILSRYNRDHYLWTGENRVRAFAEWRLLADLWCRGLPVPQPVAARYRRSGLTYRCDLITRRIDGAQPLSGVLAAAPMNEARWRAIGAAVARLHAAGADHADLNAHNILVDPGGLVSIIDFDRGRLRKPGAWKWRNLSRLRRSFEKIARALPQDRYPQRAWEWLLAGYASPL